jgi:hypothetical protein
MRIEATADTMTRSPADKRLTFSMTENDHALLVRIQQHVGLLSASAAIRYALKRCAEQIDAESKPEKGKPKRR